MILTIEPRITTSWDEFIKNTPVHSIGLDGYIEGVPQFDPRGPHANFNHHEDVERLATKSTAGQVLMAIKMGLLDVLDLNKSHVFVNDADPDVCLATWILENHTKFIGTKSEPLISRLMGVSENLDITSGMYPYGSTAPVMQELAWIYDPYVESRISGRLQLSDALEMKNIIDSVHARIDQYTSGKGQRIELDTHFIEIGGGDNWKLVQETGFYARSSYIENGILAFVAVQEGTDGCFSYTIGKASSFVPFPIIEIYEHLNKLEGIPHDAIDRWGGSDIIGGSPRMGKSKLSPKGIETIINRYIGGL